MNLSIGALSNATGVPANTLRTWQRRYGFPAAARTDGGQRVYAPECVEQVRLVARGIELGHRPAHLVVAPLADLRALCGGATEPGAASGPRPAPATASPLSIVPTPSPPGGVDAWLGFVAALDGESLDRAFRAELARAGLDAFLDRWAGPFLEAVGVAWATGRLQPFQEHFAAERLREFLVACWRPMAESNVGPVAILTTVPGERHGLGLHIAACSAAAAGWRIIFLGVETPLPDIAACVAQAGAAAVLVSVSSAASAAQVAWDLQALQARLPVGVSLVVGGAGAPADASPPPWGKP